ncbi:hypothetical protein AOLI_G00130940 [Acnodon oligacanthus]
MFGGYLEPQRTETDQVQFNFQLVKLPAVRLENARVHLIRNLSTFEFCPEVEEMETWDVLLGQTQNDR